MAKKKVKDNMIFNNNKSLLKEIAGLAEFACQLSNISDYEGSEGASRLFMDLTALKNKVSKLYVCPFKSCIVKEKNEEEVD